MHKKTQFWGVNRLERGAWIVCRFKRGLGKKERMMFFFGGGGGGGMRDKTLRFLLVN